MEGIVKNAFKGIGIFIVGLVVFVFVFLIIIFVNHKYKLYKEEDIFVPNGQMVEVNGHSMHIYTEGEGDISLVFMSGGGTSSPVLDFKSLYSLLSDKYKIVVVEKKGYGFSEVADVDRDIDTILSETREALSKAEIKGQYILMPHSMSGIEALYWAQMYPDEVKAIIGLDMAVPESYVDYDFNMPLIKISSFAANIGITRWIPDIAQGDATKYGTLTDEEKELYSVIFFRRTATKTMINEIEKIKENAAKVEDGGQPNIPMLMFSSNGEGTGWDKDEWQAFQENYIKTIINGELINLDASHYIHDIEYEKIATETETFIRNLEQYINNDYNSLDDKN